MHISRLLTIMSILGALAFLSAGCSKDSPGSEYDEDAWRDDESLPVPIQFGSVGSEVQTKSAITDLSQVTDNIFGVYACADTSIADMKTTSETIFSSAKKAKVKWSDYYSTHIIEFVAEDGSTPTTEFYPASNKYWYSFYSYYTGTDNVSGVYEDDKNTYYIKDIPFTAPYKDILWGKCSDADLPDTLTRLQYEGKDIYGFNSRFSRAAAKTGKEHKYFPKICYGHITTSVRFYAKADPDLTATELQTLQDNLTIDSLYISSFPTTANLIVASQTAGRPGTLEPSSQGTLTVKVTEDVKPVQGGNGTLITYTDAQEGAFFLPPGTYDSMVTLCLLMQGERRTISFRMEYPIGTESEKSSDFLAGKRYSFVILFKSLEVITIKTTLNNWDDDETVTSVDPFA